MAGGFSKWWRAGEEGAVAVYGQDESTVALFRLIAGFCFIVAAAMGLASCWRPQLQLLIGLALMTLMGVAAIASGRSAVIFTSTEFVVRPQFNTPTRILYSSISRMTKTTIPTGRYGGRADAIILQMPFGQTYLLRLNVEKTPEMLERLQQATGKEIR